MLSKNSAQEFKAWGERSVGGCWRGGSAFPGRFVPAPVMRGVSDSGCSDTGTWGAGAVAVAVVIAAMLAVDVVVVVVGVTGVIGAAEGEIVVGGWKVVRRGRLF